MIEESFRKKFCLQRVKEESKNFISGIFLVINKPFVRGYRIKIHESDGRIEADDEANVGFLDMTKPLTSDPTKEKPLKISFDEELAGSFKKASLDDKL
ncbi:unnamed protein product [Rotaria sp. Silwood2]|nr:unnamed protein product [Rotaria sp. Silwood2]